MFPRVFLTPSVLCSIGSLVISSSFSRISDVCHHCYSITFYPVSYFIFCFAHFISFLHLFIQTFLSLTAMLRFKFFLPKSFCLFHLSVGLFSSCVPLPCVSFASTWKLLSFLQLPLVPLHFWLTERASLFFYFLWWHFALSANFKEVLC